MKAKIIQKSAEMFLNLGFKSVTMDEIADKLAISKKTIYAHFVNKEALIDAVSLYIFAQINAIITKIESKHLNPIEETFRIKEIVSRYLKGDKTSPEYQLKKYYPNIYAKLDVRKKEIINTCFKNNLKRGIKEGCFREDINIDLIAKFYYICITAIKNDALFFNENTNETFQQYLEYHIRAIASEKGLKTLNAILSK